MRVPGTVGFLRVVHPWSAFIPRNHSTGRSAPSSVSQWPHGQLRQLITYKAAAIGIAIELMNEAYASQTCPNPQCGHRNKPKGRIYRCSQCGYVGLNVGATNMLSTYETGKFGQRLPCSDVKYRHRFAGQA